MILALAAEEKSPKVDPRPTVRAWTEGSHRQMGKVISQTGQNVAIEIWNASFHVR